MLKNKIHLLTVALFIAIFFLAYLVPIASIDFWWHIASGRNIVETGIIPSVDPFFVFDDSNQVRTNTVLKGQWLGQVVLYGVYHYFSNVGLMAFRTLILVTCLIFIYIRMRMFKVTGISMWLPLLVAALIFQLFSGERPQLFSFFFLGLLFLLWEGFQHRENRLWLLPFPFIIALWSNVHGGFLLGIVLVGVLVGIRILSALGTPGGLRQWLGWLSFITLLVVLSVVNPNGIDTYIYLFQLEGSELQSRTSEYMSVFALYRFDLWVQQIVVLVFLALAVMAIFHAYRKRNWDRLIVLVFLMLISLSAYRYVVFFVIVATPYIAQSLMGVETKITDSINGYEKWAQRFYLVLAALALSVYVIQQQPARSNDRFVELHKGLMLIKQKQGTGYTFNTINIGGYLMWYLWPDIRTFVDGRMLNEKKLIPYTHILWTTDHGKKWFDQAGFDWVIMTKKNQFTGEHYSLVPYLQNQRQWRVFFQTNDWIIFEKKPAVNKSGL